MAIREGKWRCLLLGREPRRPPRMELPEARWAALQPGQPVNAVIRGGWSVLELKQ